MHIQLDTSAGLGLMNILAAGAASPIENGILQIPESVGNGYINKIGLGPMMRMVIHHYDLHSDITLDIPSDKTNSDWITFSFRNVFLQNSTLPCVQVSSAGVNLHMCFPARTKINTILIHIHGALLKELVNDQHGDDILQTVINAGQPFLYEEICSPEILSTAARIMTEASHKALKSFHYRIKAEELLCLFLHELLKRKAGAAYPVNLADLKIIYELRDRLIRDLTVQPNLTRLAASANMSVSKVNRLFKQVFGTTVCNYHQKLRIKTAAGLIRERRYSVAEAGYELGFSNLSHFTRIFSKHMGMNPKKYSLR
jgi:AraC-like DNA-binding protein